MKFNSLIPELTVRDLSKTKYFYLDILGFKIEYERQEDLFVFLSLEENQLMFEEDNGHWNTAVLEYPYGRGVNFEMKVSDVERLYQKILNAGISPFRELTINNYKTGDETSIQKEFLVQDPDGYLLRFTN